MASRRSVEVVAILGVGLLVALAGCSGILGGDGDGGGGGEGMDRTPGPVETTPEPPDVTNVTLPPGVNETRLLDSEALLSAHARAMAESGFAYTFEHTLVENVVNGTNTTRIAVTGEARATPGLAAFHRSVDRDVPVDETKGVWINRTEGFEREVADGTSYDVRYGNATKRDTQHYVLESALTMGEWYVETAADGRLVLVSDDTTSGVTVQGRMVVDPKGRILNVNVTMVSREYDDDVESRVHNHRTIVYNVTAVGDVAVSPPDWVDEARNTTGRIRAPGPTGSP